MANSKKGHRENVYIIDFMFHSLNFTIIRMRSTFHPFDSIARVCGLALLISMKIASLVDGQAPGQAWWKIGTIKSVDNDTCWTWCVRLVAKQPACRSTWQFHSIWFSLWTKSVCPFECVSKFRYMQNTTWISFKTKLRSLLQLAQFACDVDLANRTHWIRFNFAIFVLNAGKTSYFDRRRRRRRRCGGCCRFDLRCGSDCIWFLTETESGGYNMQIFVVPTHFIWSRRVLWLASTTATAPTAPTIYSFRIRDRCDEVSRNEKLLSRIL